MSEDPGWVKRTKQLSTGIGAITAVVTASVGLFKEVTGQAVPVLQSHPEVRWLLFITVFALGVVLWLRRPRRGRALPPAAPRPLVGRDRDLENILAACVSHRLVFLVGESGVGKSALIERALRPAIADDKRFTLVVVRDWGDDWIRGPERMMAAAVEALGAGDASAGVTVSWIEYAESLARRQLGRLLIVFDGFDDYSVRFHDRLFVHDENRFLTPAQLCDANPFWRALDKLLRDDLIHCVFVTRADAQKALGPVRFLEPNERYLFKLSRTTARELIESTIKTTDDRDWLPLCNALLADLDDGGVLPAQLVSAERALRRLSRRTVREYRAKGGLVGLELEQLLEIVNQAARAASVPITSVLQLLNRMTDELESPPKARSLTINAAAFPSTGPVSFAAARTVIRVLEREQVVRQTQPSDTWILYHDYAARTVAALRRRTDHWTARMAEAWKRVREARGPLARYFSLLSPPTQLVLLSQRILAFGRSGAFRYAVAAH